VDLQWWQRLQSRFCNRSYITVSN